MAEPAPSRPRVAVTGANGQLGRALAEACRSRAWPCVLADHAQVAVEDAKTVRHWLQQAQPQWLLHCAAWTDVDGCERDPQRAFLVNAQGTAVLAQACSALGIALLYVSTDFVFDGSQTEPYTETAATNPLSQYGRSKLQGEQAVLAAARANFYVLRTSWVFGPGGANFPRAILRRARSGQPLTVVTDQCGRPTYAPDLAEAMLDLVRLQPAAGLYHAANLGACSWHGFAQAIVRAAGLNVPVGETTAAQLARPAARPAYSVLDTRKLDAVRGVQFPHYESALQRYLAAESSS